MNRAALPAPSWTAALAALPPEWFLAARWFQGKASSVREIRPVDVLDLTRRLPSRDGYLCIALAAVTTNDGSTEMYQLPFCVEPADSGHIGPAIPLGTGWRVREALEEPALHVALARLMREGCEVAGEHGRFRFESLPPSPWQQVRPLAQTSTNSLVLVKADVICKFIRRVSLGPSPELEMNRFFATAGTFRNLPPMEGALSYVDAAGGEYTLVLAQRFVDNQGDLWQGTQHFLSSRLKQMAEKGHEAEAWRGDTVSADYMDRARRLARVLATMHRTLTTAGSDAAFAPEPITPTDLARWSAAMEADATALFDKIAAREPGAHPALRDLRERLPDIRRQAVTAFRRLAAFRPDGWIKCRVHGDFHLGQVLQVDDDFFVIDFEGEPLKPALHRAAKYSPLKDVAGLLRSFNYAAYAALFAWADRHPLSREEFRTLEQRLVEWNRTVEQSVRRSYFESMGWREHGDLPSFLAALKLEKAIYELDYEFNNRPAWLPIPCGGIQASLEEFFQT